MNSYVLTERSNLFEPNVYIQVLVQMEGVTSLEAMEEAVKKAFAANESTMSRIVIKEDGTAYYDRMTESGCRVMVAKGEWQELVRKNEKIPFRIQEGELVRVFLIADKEDIKMLIMAHHLAGDGKSILYFLEDVMNALIGKKLDDKPLELITKESLSKKSKLFLGIRAYVSRVNRKWMKKGKVFTWKDYDTIQEKYWKLNSSHILFRTFSEKELTNIKEAAKKAEVSINSYIITAFLKADLKKKVVGIPVDVREHNHSMSNQVSGISITHPYSEKSTFEENMKAVHKKIGRQLKNPYEKYFVLQFLAALSPTLLDSVLLCTHGCYQNMISEKLAAVMGYLGDKTRDLGITNLGKLWLDKEYGPYKIKQIIFVPPAVSYARHVLGVSTWENEMTITYHFVNQQEDEEKEKEFFQAGIRNMLV